MPAAAPPPSPATTRDTSPGSAAPKPRKPTLGESWRARILTPFPGARREAAKVALMLTLPALGFGLFADDYMHVAAFEGALPRGVPLWDLFDFAPGDPAVLKPTAIDRGPFPWWTLPDLKLSFFRPLSSLLAAADHAVFGRFPPAWHAHSLLWFVGVVLAWGTLLRRVMPTAVGALALMLFAIDDSHWMPAAWWANRNAVISALFGVLALHAHLRWREDGWRPGLPLSALAWVPALLAGEAGLSAMAYVLAYEVVAGPGRPLVRAAAVLPTALLGAGYLVVYKALGYGARLSGSYIDPISEPGAYLAALAVRLPVFVEGLYGGIPADLWLFAPFMRPALFVLGLVFGWMIWRLLRWALPELSPEERRAVTWLGLGSTLSLLPLAATFPTSRLLLIPSFGGMVVVGAVLHRWFASWEARAREPGEGLRRFLCGGMVRIHTVYAPFLLWGLIVAVGAATATGTEKYLGADFDDQGIGERRVALVASPDPMAALYPVIVRQLNGHAAPKAWWPLSFVPRDHRLSRVDERTFDLEVLGGQMMETEFEVLFRHPDHPLAVGDRFELDGMGAEVLRIREHGPDLVRFRFDRPLEDPSLLFLTWQEGELREVEMPKVGESVVIGHGQITFLG